MIHRVADSGFAVTYAVEQEDGFLIVDVGSAGASEKVLELITRTLGRKIDDIKFICATHFHIDHIAGIGHLVKKCPPSTMVLFNYKVREYLEGKKSICPMSNWIAGLVPAAVESFRHVHGIADVSWGLQGIPLPVLNEFSKPGFDPGRIIFAGSDEDNIWKLGFGDWQIIQTPGHTEDSISLFSPSSGDLICGDLILNFEKNGKGKLNRFHWDAAVILDTLIKLQKEICPGNIYPGHGEVISSSGNALLDVEIT
jgi:glyoxylase-like metal-dependent hydrolase (beta-lactamase superfamily II)